MLLGSEGSFLALFESRESKRFFNGLKSNFPFENIGVAPMSKKVAVDQGPSGRTPMAATKRAEGLHCVLFEDGTIGLEATESTLDDSGYDLVYHQPSHVRLVEFDEGDDWKISRAGIFSLVLLPYSILYLSMREYIHSPLADLPKDVVAILCVVPFLIFYLFRHFRSYVPTIKAYHSSNTDPYIIQLASKKNSEVETSLGMGFLLGFCSWFWYGYTESPNAIACDLILLVFLIAMSTENVLTKPLASLVPKGRTLVPLLTPSKFYELLINQIKEKKQIESSDELNIINLLMSNESQTLEFKGSTWTKYKFPSYEKVEQQTKKDYDLQDEIVKTVAAFLNTDGGTLLIGVKDKPRSAGEQLAEVVGIEDDFKWLKKNRQDVEGYQHALIQLLNDAFSNTSTVQIYVEITFPIHDNRTLCRIDVTSLPRIVNGEIYVKTKNMGDEEFFFRASDTTTHASVKSAHRYIRHHFKPSEEHDGDLD